LPTSSASLVGSHESGLWSTEFVRVRERLSTMRVRAIVAAGWWLMLSGCAVANEAPAAPTSPATSAPDSPDSEESPMVESSEDASMTSPEAIVGTWRTHWGGYLQFTRDGAWGASYAPSGDPFDHGSYTFDGRSLSITTEGGASISKCEVGDTGEYQVTFSERKTTMVFSQARDTCSARGRDMQHPDGLTRHGPGE
jgi:hypothetical protein